MKLPYSMILDLVETNLTAEQVGDLLTMAGFELEGIEDVEGDTVLDFKVMANRGDGLSALGLSREILAKDSSAKPTALFIGLTSFQDVTVGASSAEIDIQTTDCHRYACRILRGAKNGASPDWLQQRIRQAGQRPISLLVDLTNYVMLEVGQPMHVFDLARLGGSKIVVRHATEGEQLTLLNGEEHTLKSGQMMICNTTKPVAVAGVMGGLDTEASSDTQDVLIESASFLHTSVRKTRKALNQFTEASYRFERSVDPEGVVRALQRFTELYCKCVGISDPIAAGFEQGIADSYPTNPASLTIKLNLNRAIKLLGMEIAPGEALQHLSRLGFDVSTNGEEFSVKAPSWRPDILREEDLVEELGRVHGYDRIPETPLGGSTTRGGIFGLPLLTDQARKALLRCGFNQTISHTLRDKHPLDFSKDWRFGPRNPHSPEMAYMRDSLLPGLAEAAARNGGKNVHLFEVGKVFLKGDYQIDESPEIAMLSTGELTSTHWAGSEPNHADFFSIKGVVEELAASLEDSIVFDYPRDPDARFHPTRQSGVLLDNGRFWAGTVGQIHPDIADDLGLPRETFMAELDLLAFAIQDNIEHEIFEISRNPSIRRDMAIVIDKSVAYATIESTIRATVGDLLETTWLFDVYEGQGIEANQHSLAIAIQMRKFGGNMTDAEANEVRDRVISELKLLGASLR